jgi:hypothetical protein
MMRALRSLSPYVYRALDDSSFLGHESAVELAHLLVSVAQSMRHVDREWSNRVLGALETDDGVDDALVSLYDQLPPASNRPSTSPSKMALLEREHLKVFRQQPRWAELIRHIELTRERCLPRCGDIHSTSGFSARGAVACMLFEHARATNDLRFANTGLKLSDYLRRRLLSVGAISGLRATPFLAYATVLVSQERLLFHVEQGTR